METRNTNQSLGDSPETPSRRTSGRRGRRGTGRGGRGRGGRGAGTPRLTAAAARQQVANQQQERTENIREMIHRVDSEQLRELVLQLMNSYPALFFDIWERQQHPQRMTIPDSPGWCTCERCREMPTVEERVCCLGTGDNCLSLRPEIDTVVIDPLVLGVARELRRAICGGNRGEEPNKANRHAAYRQFVLWHYGRLGNRNRRAVPSCVVWRIRSTFPDPHDNYVGYIPGRLL
ncbi:uncharacterized protein [Apostichopus japonicus]